MYIPFLGELTATSLILAGISGLLGYVIGSQLKSAIKIALIILFLVTLFGLITPLMLRQLAEYIVALKPLFASLIGEAGETAGFNLSLGTFILGFVIGLVKG